MSLDPRTPVLVGAGQVVRHTKSLEESAEPAALMEEAALLAAADAGGTAVLGRVDSMQVVQLMSFPYVNAAYAVAGRLGIAPRETVESTVGGNSPQLLINEACTAIQSGVLDTVLITGAETINTRHIAHRQGAPLPWPSQPAGTPPVDRYVGTDKRGNSESEVARSLSQPVNVYPVFETAIRRAHGRSFEEHQLAVSALWERFSAVAADNPYAWDQVPHSASEIRTASPKNRWIGWPYTKLMVAYAGVDQAAALILTSVATATALGIPSDQWVFPWAGSDCNDHWFVSSRADLCSSPGIAANGAAVCGALGIGADDVAHVDLYSCFPSAVQIGAEALGLGLDRQLTVTGGLSFFGGPLNDYVTHSVATMAGVLRADPGSLGLVTALGWYCTKHSLCVYSTTPPPSAWRAFHPQEVVDATPSRPAADDHVGPVSLEAWAVMHDRDGAATVGLVSCLTPDGARAWAATHKPDVMEALKGDELDGAYGQLLPDGELDLGN